MVGERPHLLMGDLVGVLAIHRDGLAVYHLRLALRRDDLTGMLYLARSHQCGRHQWAAGLQSKARGTGVAPVQSPVRTARALHVDAEQVAFLKDLTGVGQRAQRLRAAGTVHGEHSHRREPPFLEPALMPLPSKYSALPMKCTMRGQVMGISASSMTARWFAAMMAPPSRGTFSSPIAVGPIRRRAIQPKPLTKNQYSTMTPPKFGRPPDYSRTV